MLVVAFERQKWAVKYPCAPHGIGGPKMKNTVWTTQAVCILGLVVLSGCASAIPAPTAATRPGTSQDQATIQAFQKRLLERERTIARQSYQIEVMSSQLDALKRIDQDIKGQQRPVRDLMNVAP